MPNYNRSGVILIVLLVLVVAAYGIVSLTDYNIPYFNIVEKGIYNLVSPLINLTTGIYNTISDYWQGIFQLNKILAENEELEKDLAAAERKINRLQMQARENKRLRELLAFKELVPYQTMGARVIGYAPSPWQKKMTINKGREHGIKLRMPVISYNGLLVGRIDYVGSDSSQIKLVNDPGFVVGGIIESNNSRTIGLVKGQLQEERYNTFNNVNWDAKMEIGDLILTSGLSDNYPKGLPIGKVKEVKQANYGLSQKAILELFFANRTIEEVLVITEF